eukprot:TRINITY_DN4293_c1_g1_i3.p1 TRINITY_DN4293_c1_g1~~TRINITY_DN4293_c1_g1_i3.p1  ORF type:complete len:479 (-),score=69.21 TRINITY_DN4293_c1_g1_i3:149-1585(-)
MALVTAEARDLDPDYLDDWCCFYGPCKFLYDGKSLQITYADILAAWDAAHALECNGVSSVHVCEVPGDPVAKSLLVTPDEDVDDQIECFGEDRRDTTDTTEIPQITPTVIALSPMGELVYPVPPDFSEVAKKFTAHEFGDHLRALGVITLQIDSGNDKELASVTGMAVALSPQCIAISKHLLGRFERKLKRLNTHNDPSHTFFVVSKITTASLKMCHAPREIHDVSSAIMSYIQTLDAKSVLLTKDDDSDGCAVQEDFALVVLTEPLFHNYFVPCPLPAKGPYAIIARNSAPSQTYVVEKLFPYYAGIPTAAKKCFKDGQLLLNQITGKQLLNLYTTALPTVKHITDHFYAGFHNTYVYVANETTAFGTRRSFQLTLTSTDGASGAPCVTPGTKLLLAGLNSAFRGRNHLVRVDTHAFAASYIAAMQQAGCSLNRDQKKYLLFVMENFPDLELCVKQLQKKHQKKTCQSKAKRPRNSV